MSLFVIANLDESTPGPGGEPGCGECGFVEHAEGFCVESVLEVFKCECEIKYGCI